MTFDERRRPFEQLLVELPDDRIEVLLVASVAGCQIGDLLQGEDELDLVARRAPIFFSVFGDRAELEKRPILELTERVFGADDAKAALVRRMLGAGNVVPLHGGSS